ncbi:MAG: hypothetical protein QOD63_2199, partial [Actinomycetota bacterium]|nr:hypothetical protein [Actinomycetota bacterium]
MGAMVRPARRGQPVLVVAVMVALSVLAACSGGDGGSSGGDDPDSGLTGEPILVGLINQEDTPIGSFPELRRGAESAIRHVNND